MNEKNAGLKENEMTDIELRDHFAEKVLCTLIALPETEWCPGEYEKSTAKFSYSLADAMMAARD